ncbi:hypothetical protein OU798_21850 [Prolixibacteraceae bacterium Z1-6]|uniref:Uncharacterized protein n=1 Tax=Draconibacterium aestuarii TaxID=2998507 RepID=A0A9X3FAS0_9BACT|nr:hypothetical protein [Prolixibacteraceae bacterium Z1-6]
MSNKNKNIRGKHKGDSTNSGKRMFLYSSVILISIVLMVAVYVAVNYSNKTGEVLSGEKKEMNETAEDLGEVSAEMLDSLITLSELSENLESKQYKFEDVVNQQLYSDHPHPTEMLSEILGMIRRHKVKWHAGGISPEEGFDAPGFVCFVINRHSKTKVADKDRYNLREILPSIQKPDIGDVVFYKHGFTMIYYEYEKEPFVVGMTPLGIVSLKYDFGPEPIGFGEVEY